MKRVLWYRLGHSILLLALIFLVVSGCSRGRKYEDAPMDVAWERIMEKFNRGRYLDAADRLEIFLINHSGSALADSAQFILAESHYRMKEYIISASEFQKTFVQYPQSSLAEEAEYKMGMSYFQLSPKYSLDQDYTQRAIDTFQLFIEDFPNSELVDDATEKIQQCREKLAHKEFFNGLLYHKMNEYPSAILYFEQVLNNYYDTDYAARSQFYIANGHEKQKKWEEAIENYTQFLNKYPDHSLTNAALRGLNSSRSKLRESQKKSPGIFQPAGELDAAERKGGS